MLIAIEVFKAFPDKILTKVFAWHMLNVIVSL